MAMSCADGIVAPTHTFRRKYSLGRNGKMLVLAVEQLADPPGALDAQIDGVELAHQVRSPRAALLRHRELELREPFEDTERIICTQRAHRVEADPR